MKTYLATVSYILGLAFLLSGILFCLGMAAHFAWFLLKLGWHGIFLCALCPFAPLR